MSVALDSSHPPPNTYPSPSAYPGDSHPYPHAIAPFPTPHSHTDSH